MNPLDMDSAEIRILRAITELNNRIMMQATPEQRAILRGSIENLRRELIPLWNPSTSTVKTTFARRGVASSIAMSRRYWGELSHGHAIFHR